MSVTKEIELPTPVTGALAWAKVSEKASLGKDAEILWRRAGESWGRMGKSFR
jgi:hypothetical protein